MVKVRKDLPIAHDGLVNVEQWLSQLNITSPTVRAACYLSRAAGEDQATPFGQSCFLQSLEIAEIVSALKFDDEVIAASLIYLPMQYADLSAEDAEEQLGAAVSTLVTNALHLQDIAILKHAGIHSSHQVDNIRKMLLAMVRDVRVVILKLAERLCLMRAITHLAIPEQTRLAQETMEIYAPLASRLGVSELKWELEDLAFSILHNDIYKNIAKGLDERRVDREHRVESIISTLNDFLTTHHIEGQIQGRAKHIYSIYRKMHRKKVSLDQVYDAIAVRVLVPTIEDCYAVLGMTHEKWTPIREEFDDYVAHPKPNGYRSIHTAVMDEHHKHFEIQIRTFAMHEESEMGVAAHWAYKEGAISSQSGYEEKIKWLRQLLEWQKELSDDKLLPSELERSVFEDRIYVFTPQGEIIDLPTGATPLDFAYTIHTELGHRCRGAKIAGKITPLTTPLKMGQTIEILTTKKGAPSRDWLIPQNGYLKTPRARAKVLNWFRKQDYDQNVIGGRESLEKEIKRLNLHEPNLEKLAHQLNYKETDAMFAALGHGDLRLSQILHLIETDHPATLSKPEIRAITKPSAKKTKGDIHIYGVGDLLTHIASCCKPVPGDPILGYITQGHGISIHHQDCLNLLHLDHDYRNRLIEVHWQDSTQAYYSVDLDIKAHDRPGLVSDIAQVLSNEKISITNLLTTTDKNKHTAHIQLTIEINNMSLLSKIMDRFQQLPNVFEVSRKTT